MYPYDVIGATTIEILCLYMCCRAGGYVDGEKGKTVKMKGLKMENSHKTTTTQSNLFSVLGYGFCAFQLKIQIRSGN
jgi:hypothetical protein